MIPSAELEGTAQRGLWSKYVTRNWLINSNDNNEEKKEKKEN